MNTVLKTISAAVLLAGITMATPGFSNTENEASQVLASIDDQVVTAAQLQAAINSSPFFTQFNAMSAEDQASLRGELLKRLVSARLLFQEAKRQGLDKTEAFKKDLETFRQGLLYRYYTAKLRQQVTVPEEKIAELKEKFKGNHDAYTAARSSMMTERFKGLQELTILSLREKYHVAVHTDRINKEMSEDTVLLDGDDGLAIRYGDIVDELDPEVAREKEAVEEKLYQRAELELVARAASEEGIDVSRQLEAYTEERLPAMLLGQKRKEWVPDEKALKDYLAKNPSLAQIPAQWHVGQVVLKTREEAEKVKQRIDAGESLFTLAGELSIDPFGRQNNGDMGWLPQGAGMPQIEKALAGLKDEEVSDVIESPKGFHIVTVLDRKPGSVRNFASMKDKVYQIYVTEKLAGYLQKLQKTHKVVWSVLESDSAKPAKASPSAASPSTGASPANGG
ncbi:MAG: peptidylprolyl isomerase [bacterium]